MTIFIRRGAAFDMKKTALSLLVILFGCDIDSGFLGNAQPGSDTDEAENDDGDESRTSDTKGATSSSYDDEDGEEEDDGVDEVDDGVDEVDDGVDEVDDGVDEVDDGVDDAGDGEDEDEVDPIPDTKLTVIFTPDEALGVIDIVLESEQGSIVLFDGERAIDAAEEDADEAGEEFELDLSQPFPASTAREIDVGAARVVIRDTDTQEEIYGSDTYDLGPNGNQFVVISGAPLQEVFLDDSAPTPAGTQTIRLFNLVPGSPSTWLGWTNPDPESAPIVVDADIPYGGFTESLEFSVVTRGDDDDAPSDGRAFFFINLNGDPSQPIPYNSGFPSLDGTRSTIFRSSTDLSLRQSFFYPLPSVEGTETE